MDKESITSDNLYENLIEKTSSLIDEKITVMDSNSSHCIEELRKRARDLKMRLLRHKNHSDRHNLKNICEKGLDVTRNITRESKELDLISLEDELESIETDLEICEQEFEKEVTLYNSFSQFIDTDTLPQDKLKEFNKKIEVAISDIYSAPYSPEDLFVELSNYYEQDENIGKYKAGLMNAFHSRLVDRFPEIEKYISKRIEYEMTEINMYSLTKELKRIVEQCEYLLFLSQDNITHEFKHINTNLNRNIERKLSIILHNNKDLSSLNYSDLEELVVQGDNIIEQDESGLNVQPEGNNYAGNLDSESAS